MLPETCRKSRIQNLLLHHPLVSRTFLQLPSQLINSPLNNPLPQSTYRIKPFPQIQKNHFVVSIVASIAKMDMRVMGFDPLLNTFYHIVHDDNHSANDSNKSNHAARTYVRDAKAMASTPADVKEYPNSYVFVMDMPGLKSGDIKVQVDENNVLVVCGERQREAEKEGVKYVKLERRIGRFMRKFVLPENANLETIKAVCQDGVLTVTVEKLPPPEPKKPKIIEVKIA